MRKDLIKLIGEQKALRHIVVLTHNIDFVFIETLLLGALRRCGAPSLTVFADAQCAAETYQSQRRVISQLGRRYRVTSVSMEPGFRFHPKAVLMVAEKAATLLVGSGNLTFGGWRDNAEVWARYLTDEGLNEFGAFRQYLKAVISRVALPDSPSAEVEDAFDATRHSWVQNITNADGLVGRCGGGPTLLQDIEFRVGGDAVDRLTLCSPYFDPKGDALAAFTSSPRYHRVELLVAGEGANLTASAIDDLPDHAGLRAAWGQSREDSSASRPFLHAKAYAFQRGNDAVVFLGSANCSRAALLCAGAKGNAELLAIRQVTAAEFTSQILDEVRAEDRAPEVATAPDPDDESFEHSEPRIAAAHLANGVLRIAFTRPPSWIVNAAILDDTETPLQSQSDRACDCVAPTNTRSVRLAGVLNGVPFETPPYWVDDEATLAVRASQRTLEGEIRRKAAGTDWNLGDWQDVVKLFCKHLEDAPTARRFVDNQGDRPKASRTFTRDEVFPSEFGWPSQRAVSTFGGPASSVSLPELLMRWFVRAAGEPGESGEPSPDPEMSTDDSAEGEEPVDLPATKPFVQGRKTAPKPAPPSATDRKKAERLLKQIVSAMSSDSYLAHRHPKDLAKDLQITALVLSLARAKGWLDHEAVVDATCAIWVPLFLSGEHGALGKYLEHSQDLTHEFLKTPELAAALFGWSLELVADPRNPRDAQAWLILAVSVRRHPWVWGLDNVPAVAEEVERLLLATAGKFSESAIAERWNHVGTLGAALHELEQQLAVRSLANWIADNRQTRLPAGILVWQGPLGYCVTQAVSAGHGENVSCLPIEAVSSAPKLLKGGQLNPVTGLLEMPQIKNAIGNVHMAALQQLVASARGFVRPPTKPGSTH